MKYLFFRRGESLSVLVALLMLLSIAVLSSLDWVSYRENRKQYFSARAIVEHTVALMNALADAETSQRGFVLTGDPGYLDSYPQTVQAIGRETNSLAAALHDNGALDEAAQLRDSTAAKLAEMSRTIELRKAGDPEKSLALVKTGQGRALMAGIRALTNGIRSREMAVSDARAERARQRSDRAHLVAVLSSAILLIILGLGARILHNATLRREQLIAGQGEFLATLDRTHAIVQDLHGTILSWNKGAEALYGWSREEALGRNSNELLETVLPRPHSEIYAAMFETGSWTGEFQQRCRDGTIIWVAGHWALHRNAAGVPVSVIKLNNDITALKRSEAALRASDATARSFFENATPGILTADRQGRIVDANTMALRLFGYSRAELIGSSVDMLLPEGLRGRHADHRAAFAQRPHARPMGQGLDLVARRRDGTEFPVEISLSYVAEHPSGGLVVAYVSDISARQQAQRERESLIARLESALDEKTVLLKEVHHRVKNNLAVIAGLLGMHADAMDDERAAAALEESQQRVASMALIHEYLYGTEHLDRVNFGKYAAELAHELSASYALEPDRVAVIIDAEEIDLSVHRAIPCGLILNELFSNALKYAFPGGRSGTIGVHFSRLESGELALACGDDGVGIPESFDWENSSSVGLRVVRILAKQIDGVLTLDRCGGGTRFELRFPAAAPRQFVRSVAKLEAWSAPAAKSLSRSLSGSASG